LGFGLAFAAGFGAAGIVMPGMLMPSIWCICAIAGAGSSARIASVALMPHLPRAP
jgi:hypothetical protein